MRWACILLPQLALDATLRQQTDPDAPLVLVGGPSQRRVVHALNPAAKRLGLRRGVLLSAAHALTRDFRALPFDPRLEVDTRQMLAAWAYGVSSQVSLVFEHALVLEIGASRALFGDWGRIGRRLAADLGEMGFRHRMAAAPNPFAARVLAAVHPGAGITMSQLDTALAGVPVERSGLPGQVIDTLHRSGLRRLGQVFALPRESLARRFPPDALAHLDALRSSQTPPLPYYAPPDRFEARIEFEYDIESSQALLFPLKRLTADLAAFLSSRDGGVQRFRLYFEHEHHPDSELLVGLLAPERDAAMLMELSRSRLEQLRLPAGTRAMRLLADDLPAFVPASTDLFDTRPAQAVGWPQLRERLRARLGDEAVHGIALQADHRPECATRTPSGKPMAEPPLPPRPTWLLPRPIELRGWGHEVVGKAERIESGWWDGRDVRRDYVRVLTRDGQHAWAFRVAGDERLWLQGWFA
ncbi:Y-family DNA polymerase [Luteimonas sp. e5]